MKPSAEFQVKFLANVQRLLAEGQFTATYKYALLMAIADLAVECGDDSGAPLHIETRQLAEKFVEYYWRQAVPYHPRGRSGEVLRQNTGQPAGIIGHIQGLRGMQQSLAKAKSNQQLWRQIVRRVELVVRTMPLWKLQTVGQEKLDFLYENRATGRTIELRPGVAFCLRQFHGLVQDLVQSAWIRYIRRHNTELLGTTTDLTEFMFGSERASLQNVVPVLREIQDNECFYCGRALQQEIDNLEVDHFVAWSRYPVDLGHNFVLTDKRCNGDKTDHIASVDHLEHWVERNDRFRRELETGFNEQNVRHDLSASMSIARWAYNQTASIEGLTWSRRNEFLPLRSDWASVLSR
jgi:5-methylcytosine-specific restriction endonuclease McrA